jgi:methylmalonyl-CoA/ethylmalonyl-CoA epimerase
MTVSSYARNAYFTLAVLLTVVACATQAKGKSDNVKPVFSGISEIIMVVEDLDASVKKQWEMFGIGPWEIWTFDSKNVKNMTQHDKPMNFSIRIAYTKIGNTYWELVQPLDQKSTYYQTLKDKGEGVHNIVFDVENYDQTVADMRNKGIGTYNSGDWQGVKFINFDTRGHLPVIAEIFKITEGQGFPPSEQTYPEQK